MRAWVKDLLNQEQVNNALQLSGHHVDIRIRADPCHADTEHNTVDFELEQTNPGSCQGNLNLDFPCGGSFIASSPVQAELFNIHNREIIFPQGIMVIRETVP